VTRRQRGFHGVRGTEYGLRWRIRLALAVLRGDLIRARADPDFREHAWYTTFVFSERQVKKWRL
jgi:hypothetical protein